MDHRVELIGQPRAEVVARAFGLRAVDGADRVAGSHKRVRLSSHLQAERRFQRGQLVNVNPTGPEQMDPEIEALRALGVVINCPPMFVAPA
ncbi:MAG: hypothetical protein ACXVP7_13245 [Actinomycetota bacterium]